MTLWSYAAALALLFVGTGAATACDCDIPPLPKALERSVAIFAGRVVRVEPFGTEQVRVLLRTDRWWKGRSEELVAIATARSGASCGSAFQENVHYLVYAERYPGEKHLSTNICTRTRRLQGSMDEQQALTTLVTEDVNRLDPDAATAARFRLALTASGPDYVRLRESLLAHPDELRPLLLSADKAVDWRERALAVVLKGWLEHRPLYAGLWDWQPEPGRNRNPFPQLSGRARRQFLEAGDAAVPLMLERIWKGNDILHGALPQLLAERNEERLPPVVIDWVTRNGYSGRNQQVVEALGKFGASATPLLGAALELVPSAARGTLLEALGATGDPNAVPLLIETLSGDSEREARRVAAVALGRLGRLDAVRLELPRIQDLQARLEMLEAFAADRSPEGHRFLERYARTAKEAEERSAIVRILSRTGVAAAGVALAALALQEPDARTHAGMFIYLGSFVPRQPELCAALLRGVRDPDLSVRARAVEGLAHYPSPEVFRALVPLLRGEGTVRDAAAFAMHDWEMPGIGKAFAPFLESDSLNLRQYALRALIKDPVPETLERLAATLSHQDAAIRRDAASSLGALGSKHALPTLRQTELREMDQLVRESIRSAIRKLEATPAPGN